MEIDGIIIRHMRRRSTQNGKRYQTTSRMHASLKQSVRMRSTDSWKESIAKAIAANATPQARKNRSEAKKLMYKRLPHQLKMRSEYFTNLNYERWSDPAFRKEKQCLHELDNIVTPDGQIAYVEVLCDREPKNKPTGGVLVSTKFNEDQD